MTTREILLKAADLIERDGWCQGFGECPNEKGAMNRCVVNAIDACSPDGLGLVESAEKLRVYLRLPNWAAIVEWNDTPNRTVDEVLAALRGAPAQCEEHNCATCDCEGLHYQEAFEEMLEACRIALPFLKDCAERKQKHPSNRSLARIGSDAEDSLAAVEAAIAKAEKARGEK